jgi:thiol-disulfide isomerase/thioredoxin
MTIHRRFLAILLLSLAGCTVEEPPSPATDAPAPGSPSPSTSAARPAAPSVSAGSTAKGETPPLIARAKMQEPISTLLERARHAFAMNNLPAAEKSLDDVLAAEPSNRQALRLLTEVTQRHAMELQRPHSSPLYLKSAEAMRRLLAVNPDPGPEEKRFLPQVLYNEACTLALNGETDKAFKALVEAYDSGIIRVDQLDIDPELDNLRKLPEFQAFQRRLERKNVDELMTQMASKAFPFDFHLRDVNDKRVALSDFKGKVVIVDFWGTWCPPCRKEVPHLVELYKRYHDKGLEIVGINYENDDGDAAAKLVRTYVKDQKIPYPCVLGDEETQKQVPQFEGYPTTLFLDGTGKVRLLITGYHSLVALEAAVNGILDEAKNASGAPAGN